MSITNADFSRATAGVGPTSAITTVVNAINAGGGGGIPTSTITGANQIVYGTAADTPAALSVSASRIVGRKASGNLTGMTGTETVSLLPAATNAANGVATAAQITALEGLVAGLQGVETLTAAGAFSVAVGVTFLEPAAPATFTFPNGTKGQIKLIMQNNTNASTLPGPATMTAVGDFVLAVYNGSTWMPLASKFTP